MSFLQIFVVWGRSWCLFKRKQIWNMAVMIHKYTHAHTHTRTRAQTQARTHTRARVRAHTHTHTHTEKAHGVHAACQISKLWFMYSLQLMTTLFYSRDTQVFIPLLLQSLHMKKISTDGTPCTLLLWTMICIICVNVNVHCSLCL
jgi:hypothetical protein